MFPATSDNGDRGRVRNRRGLIVRSIIQRVARQLAERFQPDKIILFGSYAYGRPSQDSDVDLLVVMPARNEIDQSLRIEESLDASIPLDVIVRTPKNLRWRLKEGDWFLREVMARGEVLYEKADSRVGAQSRSRSGRRPKNSQRQAAAPR